MSELTAECDALKEKIQRLERDLEATTRTLGSVQSRMREAEETSRKNCDTKMELLKILGDTADHLGVSKEGTNQEISFRIWAAVHELRKGSPSEETQKLREALTDMTNKRDYAERQYRIQTGNCEELMMFLSYIAYNAGVAEAPSEAKDKCSAQAVYTRVLHKLSKMRDAGSENEELQDKLEKKEKVLEYAKGELDDCSKKLRELKEESERERCNAAKSQAEAAKYLEDLKDYEKAFKEIGAAAEKAMVSVGMQYGAGKWTKRECLIDALERLSEAALNDTVDSKIKELEQACYSAESQSGCLCKEQNPWARVKWVLNQQACKIRHQEFQVPEKVRKKLWAILSNLGMGVVEGAAFNGADEAMAILEAIEKKAYEGQNIRAACVRLKELL